MKSAKEINLESKIVEKLREYPICVKLVDFLLKDEELKVMQDYANNVSIKRLGFNDHGPVHMRQVTNNAIKMLNILHSHGIQTSLEKEEIGTFEDSMCAVILAGFMHDLGMMIGRAGHEEMSVILAQPIIDKALSAVFKNDLTRRTIKKKGKFAGTEYFQELLRRIKCELYGHLKIRAILPITLAVFVEATICLIEPTASIFTSILTPA